MYAVTVRLRCRKPNQITSAAVVRAFHSAAATSDGLEHVYADAADCDVGIVLFLRAPTLEAAEGAAASLIRRVRHTGLDDFQTLRCGVDLVAPFAQAALPLDPRSPDA